MDAPTALPFDDLFTWDDALAAGVRPELLRRWVADGSVIRVVRGLYAVAGTVLTVERRARALAGLLPPDAVATDETAAWLHGLDVFGQERGPTLPRLSFFQTTRSRRVRRAEVRSGARDLAVRDVVEVDGVPVTTPLRTACDLARLLRADRALGALDAFARSGVDPDEIFFELDRFKGYRGIIQARALVPWTDPRSGSMPESKLRYEWRSSGVRPLPTPQFEIESPYTGALWSLDLAVPEVRFGVEYDGGYWHGRPERQRADERKRNYLREIERWTLVVLTHEHVYVPGADPMRLIGTGLARARRATSVPPIEWRWPEAR